MAKTDRARGRGEMRAIGLALACWGAGFALVALGLGGAGSALTPVGRGVCSLPALGPTGLALPAGRHHTPDAQDIGDLRRDPPPQHAAPPAEAALETQPAPAPVPVPPEAPVPLRPVIAIAARGRLD